MAAAVDEVDELIGSLRSVHAGDRGHALADLRHSLLASLGSVALGPAHLGHPHSLHASPSPPSHLSLHPSPRLAPPRASQHRHPPSSPVHRKARPARIRAEPYGSRTKPRPKSATLPLTSLASSTSNGVSRSSTRQASPDALAIAVAELGHLTGSRSASRSRSVSSASAASAPAWTSSSSSRPSSAYTPTPLEPVTAPSSSPLLHPSRKSPAWAPSLGFTPMPLRSNERDSTSPVASLDDMVEPTPPSSTSTFHLDEPYSHLNQHWTPLL